MHDGQIVESGSHADLLAQGGLCQIVARAGQHDAAPMGRDQL